MRDKTLSKEKVNLITSGSVSSPHLNSKHLACVTQQAIAGDQVVKITLRPGLGLFCTQKPPASLAGQLAIARKDSRTR